MLTANTLLIGLRFLVQNKSLKWLFYAWFPITFLLVIVELIFAWELHEFSLWITDNISTSKDTIVLSGLSLSLLVLLRAIFQFLHHVLLSRIRENSTAILRLRWVKSSLLLGSDQISTSQLQNGLQEGVTQSSQFLSSIAEFYQRFMLVICLLVPAMLLGGSLFGLALFLVLCTAWMVRVLGKRVMRRGNLRLQALFELNRRLINTKANQRFLKLTGNQHKELESIRIKNVDYLNFSNKVDRDFAISNTFPQALGFLVVILVLCLASIQGDQIQIIAFAYILLRFSQALAHCAGAYSQARSMQVAFEESINLQEYSSIQPSFNVIEPIYSVSLNVGKNQQLQINSGEILWVKGPSGCGKTTFLDSLMFEKKIFVNQNQNFLTNYSSRLAYANHQIALIEGSLRENLLYGHPHPNEVTEQECIAVLQDVDFSDILDTIGLHGNILEAGQNLSTGEAQRIAIARAILRYPDLLILDEAMSGLDFECETRVWAGLIKAIPKTIIICVSHRERIVQEVDHTIEYSSEGWILKQACNNYAKAG